jgi:hypothetical protein
VSRQEARKRRLYAAKKGGSTLIDHGVVLGLLQGSVGFAGTFVFASFFEWTLHKYIMHSLLWNYPFHAHALVHHGLFRADPTYHLRREVDKAKVTFAWWNAPGLVLLTLPFFLGLGYFFGWPVFWGGLIAESSYYALYESLHWCMHVPGDRWIEKTWAFQWLNAHHYLHHRYAFKNLNVVFPLADWVLGSLVPAVARNSLSLTQE